MHTNTYTQGSEQRDEWNLLLVDLTECDTHSGSGRIRSLSLSLSLSLSFRNAVSMQTKRLGEKEEKINDEKSEI